ncbi:hypothetical protein M514_09933 [Trichuris suis]|uniref:MULE transposase domain-containing protein n=1 Tax=Trichuris suis TaxID=68888 RepID=A0A085N4B5_9BILA|nr:hypothetical protein M514_09933 [Trichuris suis]
MGGKVEIVTFAEDHVPEELRRTLDGELFLAKDAGVDRILLFATRANVDKLAHAPVWIMDGTFKTAPMVFYQIYTIHAPVGSRIFPLVYALMSGKSQALYKHLFEDLVDIAEEYELRPNPQVIMAGLELVTTNAAKSEFQGVVNKACFFHTAQSVWSKIQSSGLASHYSADESFSLKLRRVSALALLPPGEIPAAFDQPLMRMDELDRGRALVPPVRRLFPPYRCGPCTSPCAGGIAHLEQRRGVASTLGNCRGKSPRECESPSRGVPKGTAMR